MRLPMWQFVRYVAHYCRRFKSNGMCFFFNWSQLDVFSLSIPRVSSVKTQLIYCQLEWRHVSTQGVIIRPIIEPCLKYIK